ncbi:hypothetical protein [Microbacterium sp. W4I20]|uniref:hypothetical protein n=1 Tax=Microbacterium sp. W4I20 TaxID=3042262 RepID=UPI0027887066|nr:hypothetical protein [Microbacterium sp. W4I20]MDQ0727655.1 hypothetical protein [Microbacterium sp. W4I20]
MREAAPHILALTASILAASALTGCAGGVADVASETAPLPSPFSSAAPGVDRTDVLLDTAEPTSGSADSAYDPADRDDVTITECARNSAGWAVRGIAVNDGDVAKTYDITAFFLSDEATFLHTASTEVQVAPGRTEPWWIEGDFVAPEATLCVLTGVDAR